jgi:hypothetical protein
MTLFFKGFYSQTLGKSVWQMVPHGKLKEKVGIMSPFKNWELLFEPQVMFPH